MREVEPPLIPGAAALIRRHFTCVVIVAELLAAFGSGVALATVAVFETEDFRGASTLTTTSAVALCSRCSKPRLQVTVPVVPAGGVAQLPWLGVALTKLASAGRVSV